MTISPTKNHGKPRWRVNVQKDGFRKRLFFESREKALAFVEATGSAVRIGKATTRHQSP